MEVRIAPEESPAGDDSGPPRDTVLVLSQVYVPDPASVGQHMADVASELALRGYRVVVYASSRGYDDPSIRYPSHEVLDGVEIHRLPLSSFGKKKIVSRLIGTGSFMVQSFFLALFTRNLKGIFFSTSPPLVGAIAAFVGWVRRVPVAYWAMDLNPDQLIALGKLKPHSLPTRLLEWVNRFILWRASHIVALDRFMADRLRCRGDLDRKLSVIPPWPHENHLEPVDPATNPFRLRHDLAGEFVVMYSGNHSPSNPLTTLMDAALRLRDEPNLRFLFVGGGVGKKDVEAFIARHRLTNCLALPYQPLSDLKYSLPAADLHVVSLGSDMVGIIHPCKIYGAMTAGRPILFFGPRPSHVTDLLDGHSIGWQVSHGDVAGTVAALRHIRALPAATLHEMGREAQRVLQESLSQSSLCGKFCDQLEAGLKLRGDRLQWHAARGMTPDLHEDPPHAYTAGRHVSVPSAGV